MKNDSIKILRYNTGSEKQVFTKFKEKFDAVLFNANIVVHSGGAIADLVSVHKAQYIIDPQTHIFQHKTDALNSNITHEIKKSIMKYLDEMPELLSNIIKEKRVVTKADIDANIDELCKKTYSLQTKYISKFSKEKEYNKYLDFAKIEFQPKFVIAPYFMLKDEYSLDENIKWLKLNNKCMQNFIKIVNGKNEIAAQLVIEKKSLVNDVIINNIINNYNINNYSYIFIWIDDFYSFNASYEEKKSFKKLIKEFNRIGKRIIIAYGGYDAILMCHAESPYKIYGVSQSVGYGEFRPITPVGNGMPTNKYYFFPLHRRMSLIDSSTILKKNGYFNKQKSDSEYAYNYYNNICNCKQCKDIIKEDINNFDQYNESIPFVINTKHGPITRNRPTTRAQRVAAMHFLYCKVKEWRELNTKTYEGLIFELKDGYKKYYSENVKNITDWCDFFGK